MKKLNKALGSLLLVIAGAVTLNSIPVMAATTKPNTTGVPDGPKTTINDLLNTDEYIFLKSDMPSVDSKASFLMDADTGQILYTEDGEIPLPILSVTKALAGYVILDEIAKGNNEFTWESKIKAVGSPVLVSYEHNFSNVSLYENSNYTVKELFDAMMINSANAATMLLGQAAFGSEKKFVEAMRAKAQALGLQQTYIYTSTGLNKSDLIEYGYDDLEEGENQMSSADVAYMTQQMIKTYPEVLEVTARTSGMFANLTDDPFEYEGTNGLLPGYEFAYEGVNGFKTGSDLMEYTSTVVFTATQGDRTLIGVILGARNSDIRSEGAHTLLNFGFKDLLKHTFFTPDSKLFDTGTVKTKYSSKSNMQVTIDEPFTALTSFDDLQPNFYFIPTNDKYDEKYGTFNGAFHKGEVLGKIVVEYADLSFLTNTTEQYYTVNVVAAEDVNNGFYLFNALSWIADRIRDMFN